MAIFKATVPETFAPVILKKRAAALRKETGDKNICTEQELFKIPFSQMMTDTLVRPFRKSSFYGHSKPALMIVFRDADHRAHPVVALFIHRPYLRSSGWCSSSQYSGPSLTMCL